MKPRPGVSVFLQPLTDALGKGKWNRVCGKGSAKAAMGQPPCVGHSMRAGRKTHRGAGEDSKGASAPELRQMHKRCKRFPK